MIRLKITTEGKAVFEKIKNELITNFSEIINKMDKEDADALMKGMKALCNVLKEIDLEKMKYNVDKGERGEKLC